MLAKGLRFKGKWITIIGGLSSGANAEREFISTSHSLLMLGLVMIVAASVDITDSPSQVQQILRCRVSDVSLRTSSLFLCHLTNNAFLIHDDHSNNQTFYDATAYNINWSRTNSISKLLVLLLQQRQRSTI